MHESLEQRDLVRPRALGGFPHAWREMGGDLCLDERMAGVRHRRRCRRGVWFSAQATWFDQSGAYNTTSWTNAQKIQIGEIEVGTNRFVSKFDSWATAVCTVTDAQTGIATPITTLYGFCSDGIAAFRIGVENLDEANNTLSIGAWAFLRFVGFKILCATAFTLGNGESPNHPLFFIDTKPGGLLTVDINPYLPNFFQAAVTALKPGDKFSTDAVPAVTFFSVGQPTQNGLALVWKRAGEHDLFFSSDLV